jgi:hypothetical protein
MNLKAAPAGNMGKPCHIGDDITEQKEVEHLNQIVLIIQNNCFVIL